jgi:MoaE-MoaD fusion protein
VTRETSTAAESAAAGSIRIRVLFFGAARDAAGRSEREITLPASIDVAGALAELGREYPALNRFGRSLLLAVNQEYAVGSARLFDGDELAVFPPVSGGAGPLSVEL